MPEIRLHEAVDLIHQIVRQRCDSGGHSPFFFVVGAGISSPSIKLARQIEDECREVAIAFGRTEEPESDDPLERYSHWLHKAYPSSKSLQDHLRRMMESSPISRANLRLAHLLQDKTLARTAFTANFDDLLSRALSLFGQPHLTCDHPQTASRMTTDWRDIQVVQVHGSYWFYDCCNLKCEIAERSQNAPMSALLDQWLREHSPLVVGYAGWDGDIIMSALRRRLDSGKFGTPIFWFCYTPGALSSLPEWLKKSSDTSNIYFVLPEEPDQAPLSEGKRESAGAPLVPRQQSADSEAGDDLSNPSEPRLPAFKVFEALIRKFQLASPKLTQNPVQFFADSLRTQVQTSPEEAEYPDIYGFHKVIERLELGGNLLLEHERHSEPDPLDSLREAVRQADYRAAIAACQKYDLQSLPRKDLRQAMVLLWKELLSIDDNSPEKLAGYQVIADIGNRLGDPSGLGYVGRALINKAVVFGNLHRADEALATYDEVVRRFGNSPSPRLRGIAAHALVNKGAALLTIDKYEEAIEIYNDAVIRFGNSTEPAIQEHVARALVNRGSALANLDRKEEAVVTYDEVVHRFDDSTVPAVREQVAAALAYKGYAAGAMGRSDEAIALCDEVIRRFGNNPEPRLQQQVARAVGNRGFALGKAGRREEEIAWYDQFMSRFGNSSDPAILAMQARVLHGKAAVFQSVGRDEECIELCDEVIRRFGDAPGPDFVEPVAFAFVTKGYSLEKLRRTDDNISTFNLFLNQFGNSEKKSILPYIAWTLFQLGRALDESGKQTEAQANYREVVSRFESNPAPSITKIVKEAREKLA